MPRKHLIASKINSKQQNKAKLLQKLSKEIRAAAKTGGTNPNMNPRLKLAIEKALKNNLSRDSIEKNIHGSPKNEQQLLYYEYEIFGPENIKIILTAITDNNNRTIANLNGYLAKFHGQIAKKNAIKIYFKNLAIFLIARQNNIDEMQIINDLINYKIEELLVFPDGFELQTDVSELYLVQSQLQKHQYQIEDVAIKWIPTNPITISEELMKKIMKFFEQLDQDDDIQTYFTNLNDDWMHSN